MPHSITHLISEWSSFDAAAHLRELVRSQVQSGERVAVIILSANPEARAEIEELGATPFLVRKRWQFDLFALREFDVLLRSINPRIVHFWGTQATEWASISRWKIPRAWLIATLPAEFPPTHSRLRRWLGYEIASLDHIVVDYATMPTEKIVVIAPGVATPTASDMSREELLANLDLPADAQLITIAGPLTRSQRIDEAIWNFELVRTLHSQARLVILGDGPDHHRLERYARLVSEPAAIRFVSEKGVRTIFQTNSSDPFSSILACSAVYWQPGCNTSIPTALLSAQSLGIPSVANNIAAHAQVITHGENGFLVSTDRRAVWTRHTIELLENASLREQFAAVARSVIAARFSLPDMLQAYHQLTPLVGSASPAD